MKDVDKADNPSTANTADVNAYTEADIIIADNPSINTKKAIDSNGNGNSKTKCPKIVSFSINNIIDHDYFMQFIIKLIKQKNLLRFKQLKTTKTIVVGAKPTPNILNFVSFLSMID